MDWERQSKHDMDAQLDDQQRQVIDDIIRDPDRKYWINGVAGTGKSIVLLRIAEQLRLREDQPSLLLVTYTNALARMFEFHASVREIPVMQTVDIGQSVKSGTFETYDYILLDEFQDAVPSMFFSLAGRSKKGFIFSGDIDQQIFANIQQKGGPILTNSNTSNLHATEYTLNTAHRITRTGLKVSEVILQKPFDNVRVVSDYDSKYYYKVIQDPGQRNNEIHSHVSRYRKLAKPTAVLFHSNDDILSYLEHHLPEVRPTAAEMYIKYLNEPDSKQYKMSVSILAKPINDYLRTLGSPYRVLGNDAGLVNEASKSSLIVLSTIHSSKGLDFDHVVIASTPKFGSDLSKLMYVACTRAKRSTYVLTTSPVGLFERADVQSLVSEVSGRF